MYKRLRRRKYRIRINSRRFVLLIAALLTASGLLILSGCLADEDAVNEYCEAAFNERFEEITAKALEGFSCDRSLDMAEMAGFRNKVLKELRSELNDCKLVFIDLRNSGEFHLKIPAIIIVDAVISGEFTEELIDPSGNMGIYTLKFNVSAQLDDDGGFICQAECPVYQQIVTGTAPYLLSDDMFE